MMGRFAAVALGAAALAAAAMVGASACGGDTFTMADGDGSAGGERDSTASGEGSVGNPDAGGDDAVVDAGMDADGASPDAGSDASIGDAIALPDVLEEAPAQCASGQFRCVPAIPAGWDGPFEVYRGPSPPSACSPNFFLSYQGGEGVDGGPATCGCTCGTGTGVQCSPVAASFFVSTVGITGCTSLGRCTSVSLPSGQCLPDLNASAQCSSLAGTTLFTLSGSTADGGSCAPVPLTTLPLPTWAIETRACISMVALAQVDCPSGSVCAPVPAAPYASGSMCIAQQGDVPCPGSDYPNRYQSYGGVAEGRHCTACTCGPVTGSSCSGYVDVTPTSSSGTTCSGSYTRYIVPQSCTPGVQQPGDFRATVTPQPGTCTPSQTTPAGAVAAAAPTTFCCQ